MNPCNICYCSEGLFALMEGGSNFGKNSTIMVYDFTSN
jgi:hypothetical protein